MAKSKYNFVSIPKSNIGKSYLNEFDVRIRRKGITFSWGFKEFFGEDVIEVLQDEEKGVIAFRPTKDVSIGYRTKINKNSINTTLPSRWLVPKDYMGNGVGKIEDGFLIIQIKDFKKQLEIKK